MTTWYLARGAGLAALVLLTVTTALGALAYSDTAGGRRWVVQYVHRASAGLGLVALSLHLVTILADPLAGVGWRGALVPFTSGYRPAWVALGTLAAYTVLAVSTLGLARGRIAGSAGGARAWRALHALGYAGWAAALGHGFTAGSDSGTTWVRVLYLVCLAAVGVAVAARLTTHRRRTAGRVVVERRALVQAGR